MKAPATLNPQNAAGEADARARILSAAFGAFMERGYRRTSTLDIATRAKVSKRDLYALVGNKQEILQACVANRARRMAPPEAFPAPGSRQDVVETLTRFGATLIAELCHPTVIGIHRLAISERQDSPELSREIVRTGEGTRKALAKFLAQGQSVGLVGAGDPATMADLFLDLVAAPWLMLRTLIGGDPPSPQQARRRAAAAAANFAKLHLI
jgi:AcrR family transcriptional regulator